MGNLRNNLGFLSVSDSEVHLVDNETGAVYAHITHTSVTEVVLRGNFFQMPGSFEEKQSVVATLFEHARSIATANGLPESVQISVSINRVQSVRAMAGLLMCASPGMSFP